MTNVIQPVALFADGLAFSGAWIQPWHQTQHVPSLERSEYMIMQTTNLFFYIFIGLNVYCSNMFRKRGNIVAHCL